MYLLSIVKEKKYTKNLHEINCSIPIIMLWPAVHKETIFHLLPVSLSPGQNIVFVQETSIIYRSIYLQHT